MSKESWGQGMATHSNIPAWNIPRTEQPDTVRRVTMSQTGLKGLNGHITHLLRCILQPLMAPQGEPSMWGLGSVVDSEEASSSHRFITFLLPSSTLTPARGTSSMHLISLFLSDKVLKLCTSSVFSSTIQKYMQSINCAIYLHVFFFPLN